MQLIEMQNALSKAIVEDEKAKAQRDLLIDRARVIGRISAYLEAVKPSDDDAGLETRIAAALHKVEALESQVASDDVAQRVDTYLNIIREKMEEYAGRLDVEFGGSALRLDLRKLTVVADTETGPVPLYRMGSGENWVGYHVLTYLALHWWFRRKNRPVPSFAIFDQPSQAHYPADRDQDGKLDPLKDEDRTAVRELFKLMNDATAQFESPFQLIVLDHAHIDEKWFEDAIVEEWRNDEALVPLIWIN